MIVDFKYYCSAFNGNEIPPDKFDSFISKAVRFLKSKTDGYIADESLQIKDTLCELAEVYYKASAHEGISSESNDGVSVSYIDKSKTLENDLNAVYKSMLSNTSHVGYRWC